MLRTILPQKVSFDGMCYHVSAAPSCGTSRPTEAQHGGLNEL